MSDQVPPQLPPGQRPLPPDQERLWAMLAHLLYAIVGVALAFLLIGIPILIALGIAYLVLVIIASVRANNGEFFRYPLTIRFVH